MKNQKNIAVIPARGGSKRLPGKNIMPLNGKPLIEYTIDFAKNNSNLLYDTIVSTDDKEIKEIALKNGARVIDRPEELSGDTVSTAAVLRHVANEIDYDFDNLVLLQVTNPLRPKELLNEALQAYNDSDYDSLMTVSRNHQKFGKIVDGAYVPFNYKFGQRSQDLDPLYFENGLLYISNTSVIKQGKIMGNHMLPYIVNHPYGDIDIDVKKDMLLAEFFMNNESDNNK